MKKFIRIGNSIYNQDCIASLKLDAEADAYGKTISIITITSVDGKRDEQISDDHSYMGSLFESASKVLT